MQATAEKVDHKQLFDQLREAAKNETPQDRLRRRVEYAVMTVAPDDATAQKRLRRQLEEEYGLSPAV